MYGLAYNKAFWTGSEGITLSFVSLGKKIGTMDSLRISFHAYSPPPGLPETRNIRDQPRRSSLVRYPKPKKSKTKVSGRLYALFAVFDRDLGSKSAPARFSLLND